VDDGLICDVDDPVQEGGIELEIGQQFLPRSFGAQLLGIRAAEVEGVADGEEVQVLPEPRGNGDLTAVVGEGIQGFRQGGQRTGAVDALGLHDPIPGGLGLSPGHLDPAEGVAILAVGPAVSLEEGREILEEEAHLFEAGEKRNPRLLEERHARRIPGGGREREGRLLRENEEGIPELLRLRGKIAESAKEGGGAD
jgi:hypothetical protein